MATPALINRRAQFSEGVLGILSVNSNFSGQKVTENLQTLKDGDLVFFKAIKRSGKSYTLSLRGGKISVKSSLSLPLGKLLKARVVHQDGEVRLILEKSDRNLSELINRLGFSPKSGAEEAVKGLLLAHAPLDPRIIRTILAKAPNNPRLRRLYARYAGLLHLKGINLGRPGWEPLMDILMAGGDEGWNDNSGDFPSREDDKRREDNNQKDSSSLKGEAEDMTDIITPSDQPHPLHLFNHLKSNDGHWVVLPIKSRKGEHSLGGSAAVHLSSRGTVVETLIRVSGMRGEWQFRLGPEDSQGRRSLKMSVPQGTSESVLPGLDDFPEKLRNLGVDFDDNKSEDFEEEAYFPGGVDWTV